MTDSFDNTLISEIRNHLIYIQLMTSLSTGKDNPIKNPQMKQNLIEVDEKLKPMNHDSLVNQGPFIVDKLKSLSSYFIDKYPLRKSINEIALEFNEFFKQGYNPFSTGIKYGWLVSVMDVDKKQWPKDLPYQTRIGIGHNAGRASTEDEYLLRDAFYMFAKAEYIYQHLSALINNLKGKGKTLEQNYDNKLHDKLNSLKFNLSSYARLSVISFYSFIECFVNSIGYDFYYKNKKTLNPREIELLRGKKRGRYLQLEYKLEKFPTIIRQDKKQVIFIKDAKQAEEPFITLFKDYKDIRDASVHYSPAKEEIWNSPFDWITHARQFKDIAINVALLFWKACYLNSDGPEYLGKLKPAIHLKLAQKRLKFDKEAEITTDLFM